jgi:hypothetical protein
MPPTSLDPRKTAARQPPPADRAKRRKDFLDRRAEEILAAFKTRSEQKRTVDRPEIFTSAPIPSADDDLFALSPLLSSDEKAALETIGDWIPDLFGDGNQPDEETPAWVSHAKPSSARTHVDDPPVRRRRSK